MIRLFCIALTLVFISPSCAQWKREKKSKDEQIKEQALDDVAVLSQEQFPYIDKFHLAVREMLSSNYSEAKRLLNECKDEYPHDDAVYFALGEIAKRQKLSSEALKNYEKALTIDPNNIHYRQEAAYLLFDKAEFDKAVEHFGVMVEKKPRHLEWLYGYAQALLYSGQYENALHAFDRFQDQMGPVPEVTMIKIDLLKETGKEDRIERELLLLKQAFPSDLKVLKTIIGYYEDQGDKEKAIQLIKELVKKEPENGVAHFILAKHYLQKEDIENYTKSLLLVAGSEEIEVDDKMLLGQPLFAMEEDYNEVMLEFSSTLTKTHPKKAKAVALHAEVLSSLGKKTEALKEYRKALELDESTFQLWTNVLAFQSAHREYVALYEDAQKAISLFPSLPFVYYAAAEAAMMLEKYEEALDFLSMGEMYIIDDPLQEARYAKRYGEIYFRKNDLLAAHKSFEKALNKSDDPSILWSYAYHLTYSEDDLEKALEMVKTLAKFNLESLNAYYVAGYVYMRNGKLEKAQEIIGKGIEKVHFNSELYDLLGDLYLLKKNEEKAVESWEKALNNASRNTSINKKIKDKKYYAPQYF